MPNFATRSFVRKQSKRLMILPSFRQESRNPALSFLADIDLPMDAIEGHLLREIIYELEREVSKYRAILRANKGREHR